MPTHSPLVRRTFCITIDIDATIDPASHDSTLHLPEGSRYQQAFVQGLLAHPEVLRQLLRAWAVDALKQASKLLEVEYGWGRASEQQLLQPLITELEPAAQVYFSEELEDGASAYCFDGYEATVKRFRMIEFDEQMESAPA